jgi:hypothetical protein
MSIDETLAADNDEEERIHAIVQQGSEDISNYLVQHILDWMNQNQEAAQYTTTVAGGLAMVTAFMACQSGDPQDFLETVVMNMAAQCNHMKENPSAVMIAVPAVTH